MQIDLVSHLPDTNMLLRIILSVACLCSCAVMYNFAGHVSLLSPSLPLHLLTSFGLSPFQTFISQVSSRTPRTNRPLSPATCLIKLICAHGLSSCHGGDHQYSQTCPKGLNRTELNTTTHNLPHSSDHYSTNQSSHALTSRRRSTRNKQLDKSVNYQKSKPLPSTEIITSMPPPLRFRLLEPSMAGDLTVKCEDD